MPDVSETMAANIRGRGQFVSALGSTQRREGNLCAGGSEKHDGGDGVQARVLKEGGTWFSKKGREESPVPLQLTGSNSL